MEKIIINGGKKLSGEIEVPSSKNAYLPILAATLLCEDIVVLHKNPKFLDIFNMCKILNSLGAKTLMSGNDIIIDSTSLNNFEISHDLASELRSSIFSLGSILGRQKKAKVAFPGGCEIGARPIDIHIKGLESLGVKIVDRHGYLYCDGSNMKGGFVHLDFPSVGATENIMLAAVTIKGKTEISNAAKEPEIIDLQNFLNACGAKVKGAGTSIITISGVKRLHGTEYTPISDRIIAGTYLLACRMCLGNIKLTNAVPSNLSALFAKLDNSSCKMVCKNDIICLDQKERCRGLGKIETMPFPGFPTDLQAQLMACQTVADGTTMIVENMFESRFKQVPELIKMGGQITVKDRSAVIYGTKKLYGAEVSSHDLRGGAALVMAGLVADGYTVVSNINFIDRGYIN
ncbi:MAG: UDP-N-acetylglucosamine 1-carboxyvinyltransferase, partial [Clostridia bacterium]